MPRSLITYQPLESSFEKSTLEIGVLGINHKLADLKLREMLARACQKRFGACESLHQNQAFVLLSTCNRMELYFSSSDLAETHSYILNILKHEVDTDFDQKLYTYFGEECLCHLITVAAGLDSAILAETEIQGQVRKAYEQAANYSKLPHPLHYLFQKGMKVAKEIRTKYALGKSMPDLEHAIYQTGSHLFNSPEKSSILVVGASEINIKVIHHLKQKKCEGLMICNRSKAKAENLSAKFQIPLLPWEELQRWPTFDWIILGTKAPRYLLSPEHLLKPLTHKKLVMDLSFPRNADPLIAKLPNLQLLNIDQINRMLRFRKAMLSEKIKGAQFVIKTKASQYAALYLKKNRASALQILEAS